MPIPSVGQAPTNHNWVSAESAIQNIHEPEIDTKLTRRYGNQDMTGFLEMQGAMHPVASQQYQHYEDDFLHSIVKVEAQGGGGAGAAVTLTVAAAYQYVFPTGAQAPYIVAGAVTTNPVILNNTVQFPGGVNALVTARSTTTFEATPTVTGTSIPATTAATEIIITGNAWEEGTNQPESRNSRVNLYTNNTQIFKAAHKSTGTEMGQKIWFQVPDANGRMGWLWYFEGQMREKMRFENEKEVSLITGKKITNTTLGTAQPTNTITEGLIPFIENYGNVYQYSSVTGIQLADFESVVVTLDRNRGAKENTLWAGINLSQGVDTFMRDTMKNGAISYGAFGGSKEKAISFNFSSFELTGYTFHKKTYDVFNYPQLLGATGFPYANMGLIVPADKVGAKFEPGAKTSEEVPSLRINYLKGKGNNYSRAMEEWLTGAVDGTYTNQEDALTYNLRSHCGLEAFAPNRFFKLYK